MRQQSQDYLARLLATENLSIEHGNYNTASFDVENRVLRLPLWKDKGKDVNDLLIGHEVGHALFTPPEGWHDSEKVIPEAPRSMVNIIEDIRIEKKVQERYPGIKSSFKKGYKVLFDDNLFGTVDKDINAMSFMDRLNVYSKGRGYALVEFSDEELPYVNLAMNVDTWEDVLEACRQIAGFLKSKQDEEVEPQMAQASEGESNDNYEGESNDEAGEQPGDELGEDQTEFDNMESETDAAQRQNENSLVDMDDKGRVPAYWNGMPSEQMKDYVIPYAKLRESRDSSYDGSEVCDAYKEFVQESKQTVNAMVREFERKKAAFEYTRAQTSKRGTLDVNKIHQYKYSEDIFQAVTQLATAKSHGIVSVIDWSGSMADMVFDVAKQTIITAMFCKRVNIPFEFYSFTADRRGKHYDDVKVGDIVTSVRLVELINSDMNKTTFNESLRHLFAAGVSIGYKYTYKTNTKYIFGGDIHTGWFDSMGTTPLIETIALLGNITKSFQERHKIQNTNIVVMTDGSPDSIEIKSDDWPSVNVNESRVVVDFQKKRLVAESTLDLYDKMVAALGEVTGATMMCIYLSGNIYDFHGAVWASRKKFEHYEKKQVLNKFKKEGLVRFQDQAGYDEWLIVKVNDKSQTSMSSDPATDVGAIKREFKKVGKNKKHSKNLVTAFIDAVAA